MTDYLKQLQLGRTYPRYLKPADKVDPFLAAQIQTALEDKEDYVAALAREDVRVFSSYVFGAQNQPFHDWIQAIADKYPRVSFDAPIEHGKSTQMTLYRPLWVAGRDPTSTIAIMSSTAELPIRMLKVMRTHMQSNPRLHRVFPHMRMTESTNTSVTVQRPFSSDKDPTFTAIGIEGNIPGKRWTLLITDDLISFATAWTDHERQKIWSRFTSQVQGRLTFDSRHIDIGTPWHVLDARHCMRMIEEYFFLQFDAETGVVRDKNKNRIHTFKGGLWPKITTDPETGKRYGWPKARLASRKKNMPRFEFNRQFKTIALSGSLEIFKHRYLEEAKARGRGQVMEELPGDHPMCFNNDVRICRRVKHFEGDVVITGVDLAIQKRDRAHDTAMFTMGITHDPEVGLTKDILEIRRGKMEGPEILTSLADIVGLYKQHRGTRIENNQAQDFLLQFASDRRVMQSYGATEEIISRLEFTPHTTSRNKADPIIGVRGMAVDFEQKRIRIPCDDDLVCAEMVEDWYQALTAFDPATHPDDTVMASWLCNEEARSFGFGSSLEMYGVWVPD